MENKLIHTIKLEESRKAELEIKDGKLVISGFTFEDYHGQDCCENVWADLGKAIHHKEQVEALDEITKIEIKNVEEMGFIIFLYGRNDFREGILINCYNEQNGYYSSDLSLIISDGDKKIVELDIEKEDQVY